MLVRFYMLLTQRHSWLASPQVIAKLFSHKCFHITCACTCTAAATTDTDTDTDKHTETQIDREHDLTLCW